jgi:hypothetical protein
VDLGHFEEARLLAVEVLGELRLRGGGRARDGEWGRGGEGGVGGEGRRRGTEGKEERREKGGGWRGIS